MAMHLRGRVEGLSRSRRAHRRSTTKRSVARQLCAPLRSAERGRAYAAIRVPRDLQGSVGNDVHQASNNFSSTFGFARASSVKMLDPLDELVYVDRLPDVPIGD